MKTLADLSTGSDLVAWIVFAVLLVLSLLLLTGHGSWLIAGYNTLPEEERAKYSVKKCCRILGVGLLIPALLIAGMTLWEEVLPASVVWVFGGVIVIDLIIMIVLLNLWGKK